MFKMFLAFIILLFFCPKISLAFIILLLTGGGLIINTPVVGPATLIRLQEPVLESMDCCRGGNFLKILQKFSLALIILLLRGGLFFD